VHAEIKHTARAFDAASAVYDASYEDLPGIRRMRSRTSQLYLEYFPPGSRLLEINCGTGNDAVFLAQKGRTILATDLSGRMVGEVRKKIAVYGLAQAVEAQRLSFSELRRLHPQTFDGAYSNLGGLNCISSLDQVAADLSARVRPGGYFIATVMPSLCLWESLSYASRLRWRDAFRRLARGGAMAHVHGGRVHTYYYSPGSFFSSFAPYFQHVSTEGLAVALPPPNFSRAYAILGEKTRLLEHLDDIIARIPIFRSIGDHYVMVLQRKSS
jgi:ubiquinone/menaquinone biosynthesis C-methylase UbiE